MLSFQRLEVYQRAIEFLALVTEIVEDLPRGHSNRADQLVRSAESVVRNIAEGAGRWSAAVDVLRLRKLVDPSRYERGIELLCRVVAMLTKMV